MPACSLYPWMLCHIAPLFASPWQKQFKECSGCCLEGEVNTVNCPVLLGEWSLVRGNSRQSISFLLGIFTESLQVSCPVWLGLPLPYERQLQTLRQTIHWDQHGCSLYGLEHGKCLANVSGGVLRRRRIGGTGNILILVEPFKDRATGIYPP